jgi:hypothetical protein
VWRGTRPETSQDLARTAVFAGISPDRRRERVAHLKTW